MTLSYRSLLLALILCSYLTLGICSQTAPSLQPQTNTTNHILFLMHTGNTAQAFQAYQDFIKVSGRHDFELIESMGLILLDQGQRARDPETQLLTLFGAGISNNEKNLYILESGLTSGIAELELIALNFLGRYHNSRTDHSLHRAMSSNFLLIRLEALFQIAKRRDPKAIGLSEALMAKVNTQLWPLFPQIFAAIGTPEAKKILRQLLSNSSEGVRIAAVESVADGAHDDLLPVVRRLASHHEVRQQEACAAALGALKDETSVPRLEQLTKSPNSYVKLSAFNALYKLGRDEVKTQVETIAKEPNLYAIALLGSMPGTESTLSQLAKNEDIQVRANAANALLEHANNHSLLPIAELLLTDGRDLAIQTITSPGGALTAWKIIPSATQNLADDHVAQEMSLHLREMALTKSVELPEKDFLALAHAIFERQQNDLVPALIEVLVNHPTPGVIELLKKQQQKAGAPLVRNYCNLALYRLKQPGPFADNLRDWVTQQRNIDLIRFRPVVPWDMREKLSFQLTPQETSRLLVEAFEAFVAMQDDKGIDTLIATIQNGNSKNKYALIGLLMRAIQ